MKTLLTIVAAAGLLLTASGCAYNAIVGTGVARAAQFFGDVGVSGNGNQVTIQTGSKVSKLSVLGNNCTITVEDKVVLYRIEFWGKNNTVSIPESLIVRTTEVGSNQIIRRPHTTHDLQEWSTWDQTPSGYTPPPTSPPAERDFYTYPTERTFSEPTDAPEGDIEFRPPPTYDQDSPGATDATTDTTK